MTETWSVSPSVDILPFGVTIPASVPQRSEIPEGLTNYPVYSVNWKLIANCRGCKLKVSDRNGNRRLAFSDTLLATTEFKLYVT
jgi:hypothetical protein